MEPTRAQAAQAVRTRNLDASSRASRIGRRALCGMTGDVVAECTGVAGPAEDGAVETYSDSDDGVRQIEGRDGEAERALVCARARGRGASD